MGSNNKNSSPVGGGQTISGAELVYELRKIIRSYFPDLRQILSQTTDSRKRKDYRSDELITAATAMFIFKSHSRTLLITAAGTAVNLPPIFKSFLKQACRTWMPYRIFLKHFRPGNWNK